MKNPNDVRAQRDDLSPIPTYRAIARWDGDQWEAQVVDQDGTPLGEITARRLEQVPAKARAVTPARHGGCVDHVSVDLAVELAPEAEQRLHDAEDLCRVASRLVDAVADELSRVDVSAQDIATLLRGRSLRAEPRRPLVVSNAVIAACGLVHHPDVIAVQWEDRGFGVTTYCRDCVERDRSLWRDLPHGSSALIYNGPASCDRCGGLAELDTASEATIRRQGGRRPLRP